MVFPFAFNGPIANLAAVASNFYIVIVRLLPILYWNDPIANLAAVANNFCLGIIRIEFPICT